MRKTITVALFMAILAAASVSGCTILPGGQNSPTPTVIYQPVSPTPTPVPVAEQTIAPHSITSNDLDLTFPPLQYKTMAFERTADGKQWENITAIITNHGTDRARDVVLKVTLSDLNTMETLIYQEFRIGDLNGMENRLIYLPTNRHNPSYCVKMNIQIEWGKNGEYYSPIVYPVSKADQSFTLPV